MLLCFFFPPKVSSILTGRKLSQWPSSKVYVRRSGLVEIDDTAVAIFRVLDICYSTPFPWWRLIPISQHI